MARVRTAGKRDEVCSRKRENFGAVSVRRAGRGKVRGLDFSSFLRKGLDGNHVICYYYLALRKKCVRKIPLNKSAMLNVACHGRSVLLLLCRSMVNV